ncbi:similar to Saccharomyces cerevisiae YLR138W NHA1 Na+/H+ antiporter involved in sodium and potassium efflux through the plasma membrane [Maudiozyma saulgeensis]|uniref:Similar to Saccharomyces cerevisiae YLR138W NHA1 Na+/H+ antiporter involved in sodium and potassium efflux through the plasma membrane n=1 Tax=Maudiozyma saulgeensis TaxID=1789683 RepID=A0A1X7R529_9SACH|nr:similar to Saccharomyces cerevisiae YLR138W NHA1 Na+/H+ antiporter involved in sodium and potassium efflux through the plasma membrane [Kazachstania saulgeensis]
MAVWEQLEVSKAHVAYACVGVFSSIFSLVSLFIKEKLYIGESTVAGIFGIIVGPVCLDWFNPLEWGNSDSITLEITRIVLCLQIFAVAVELPRKYMLKHWLSIVMLLIPVMTIGWLIIGLFIWILIPGLNFSASLLVSACITATDPILAQSVVSGKFAQRVPGHLRNLLSAESGCNDGMAFPFIYLSLNLILYPGNAREIVKDWICVTILYECIFGAILGVFIGYVGKRAIKFAEEKNIIDRESFLAFYVVLSFCCAGFGSILGVDDLLVSFSAGATFAWDGWFSKRTEESKVSTVIDLLLNYAYFIYFGAIVPWKQFNNGDIGCNVWRLIILAFVVIFLRRIPAVLAMRRFIPDIKSWREALFVGHFGPIGVGAIFAAILSRSELEASVSEEETPLKHLPEKGTKHYQLIACVWPIVCFFIVTSIIVHGSSVAIITLGRHLNTITLTKTFTTQTFGGGGGKSSWMQRLPSLDKAGRSFSLQRVDTTGKMIPGRENKVMSRTSTVETSGVPVRHAGGMTRRRKHKKHGRKHSKLRHRHLPREIFRSRSYRKYSNEYDDELNDLGRERLQREKEARAATFALSSSVAPQSDEQESTITGSSQQNELGVSPSEFSNGTVHENDSGSQMSQLISPNVQELPTYPAFDSDHELYDDDEEQEQQPQTRYRSESDAYSNKLHSTDSPNNVPYDSDAQYNEKQGSSSDSSVTSFEKQRQREIEEAENTGKVAYTEGDQIIIENKHGEILDQAKLNIPPDDVEGSLKEYEGEPPLHGVTSHDSGSSLRALKHVISPASLTSVPSIVGNVIKKTASRHSSVGGISLGSSDGETKHKYHAYKIDNLLIIENEEGDVVRRYKINPHANENENENENNNDDTGVVSKALSAVGLRSRAASSARRPPVKDGNTRKQSISKSAVNKIKQPATNRILTPAPTQMYSSSRANAYKESESGSDYTSDENDSIEYDDDDDEIETNDDYEYETSDGSDYESETEFERQRRLNALGLTNAPIGGGEDDEEEEPTPTVNSRERAGSRTQNLKSSIAKKFSLKKGPN